MASAHKLINALHLEVALLNTMEKIIYTQSKLDGIQWQQILKNNKSISCLQTCLALERVETDLNTLFATGLGTENVICKSILDPSDTFIVNKASAVLICSDL